jgi:hypothetical protein
MSEIVFLYEALDAFEKTAQLYKVSYIEKLPNGKYRVLSEKGKNLGTYTSKAAAKKRLKQVEYFKHLKKIKKEAAKKLDLSKIEDFSYSSIMRKINKHLDEDACKYFAQLYKDFFDAHLIDGDKNGEEKSLAATIKEFNKKYPLKLNSKFIKEAANNPDNAELVAKYLANVIKFSLTKISDKNRNKSIQKVKDKLSKLDITNIAGKKMPASSAMGQSITFVKHTLFGQDPQYIKKVLEHILRNL